MGPAGYTWQCLDILLIGWEGPGTDKTDRICLTPPSFWSLVPDTASPQAGREALICGHMLLKDTTTPSSAGFLFVLVGKFTLHLENITVLVVTEMED